jgi:hypothetical protein
LELLPPHCESFWRSVRPGALRLRKRHSPTRDAASRILSSNFTKGLLSFRELERMQKRETFVEARLQIRAAGNLKVDLA